MIINKHIPDPRGKVGEQFGYRYGKQAHRATITGYQVTVDTDTGNFRTAYKAEYEFLGQIIPIIVPLSTVDRQLIANQKVTDTLAKL